MAYGLKYELYFSDIERKRWKIEILQKDFVLDPFGLGLQPTQIIGTGQPCVIEWDADDDIYSPIIGSRCTLNFFVTNTTIYDEFYKADEREYKVKILEYTSFGKDYDEEDLIWNVIDQNWDGDVGSAVFYNPIWEGFIVTDSYQEAVITAPYEISIQAIDGLGTLSSFDVPYPNTNSSDTEDLFFYLKEILKNTGHEFDIYIANDTRKDDGAANDTIFHDIVVNEYAFSNENLIFRDAKEALEAILKITNSRIFQSYARWYIVNNSTLIDSRIVQSTTASSGDDIVIEPDEPQPDPNYETPVVTIQGVTTMYTDTTYSLIAQNTGSEVVTLVWTLPNSSTVTQNKGDLLFGIYYIGAVSLSDDNTTYSVTGTDSNGQSDSDSFTLDVQTRPQSTGDQTGAEGGGTETQEEETPVNFELRLNINNNVTGAYISQTRLLRNYAAGEVGDSFSMSFDVTSLYGEFTSASQITSLSTTYGTISKSLQGDFIRITVTGTLPTGGHKGTIDVKGASDVQQFTDTFNVTDSVTDATVVQSSVSATAGSGKAYSKTITVNANSGYQFNGIGNISVLASSNIGQSISVSLSSDTQLIITVSGTIGVSDRSTTLTVSGAAISANNASSLTINPSRTTTVTSDNGYFDISISSNGNFYVTVDATWVTLSAMSGSASTSSIRVYIQQNTSYTTSRSAWIRFYPSGSSTQLRALNINQPATS